MTVDALPPPARVEPVPPERLRAPRRGISMASVRSFVRPLVTVIFAVGVVVGFFSGRLNSDQFLSIATVVISFWYASRAERQDKGS